MDYCLRQAKLKKISEVDYIFVDYSRRKSLLNDGPGYVLENDYLKTIIDFPKQIIRLITMMHMLLCLLSFWF